MGKHMVMEPLSKSSFEYEFIKKAFMSTSKGDVYNASGSGMGGYLSCDTLKVLKIEKIYNQIIFDKFKGELQRNLRKYPNKSIWDNVKLLFNGSQ